MSQNDRILDWLQKGKTLTPLEALNRFDCFRLAARINDLRAEGYPIHSEIVRYKDSRYARYWLGYVTHKGARK